jgi:hypothetical protein
MHKDNWRSGAHVVVADFDDPQTIRATFHVDQQRRIDAAS